MKSMESRVGQLKQLNLLFERHEDELYEAIYKDLRKCRTEANLMELLQVRIELGNAVKNIAAWMKPERVSSDLMNITNTSELRREPLGVVLMIAPWNYPIQLFFSPLVGALAAGNCVILKPSELSPHTSALFAKLISEYMDPDVVQVVEGAVPETTALLRERFDLIFYTGNSAVGKIVMRAAAEHLTPTVLELGGKSPCVVDGTCNMDVIAQRITWAKFANCGQTCIAPDFIICIGDVVSKFVESMKKAITKFYGENVQASESYGRIINARHFKRVCDMIDESKVVFGNVRDEGDLFISPTLMTEVSSDDLIMSDEIFGPVLPIMQLGSAQEAIEFINGREKPLALYVFSNNHATTEDITNNTSSGGVCINDCVCHAAVPNLPFGGVGNSGMGRYHGKASFDTFSNIKSYLYKNQYLESVNALRYPPYDPEWSTLKVAEWAIKPTV